jgi:serine phosphatase RsbU (regulator of sigma subunit)
VLSDTLPIVSLQRDFYNPESNPQSDNQDGTRTLTWEAGIGRGTGPVKLSLTYKPVEKSVAGVDGGLPTAKTEHGIQPVRFYASYHELDHPDNATDEVSSGEIIFSVVSVSVSVLLIVVAGLRQVFKGEVIWARSLILLSVLAVGYIGYRILALQNLYYSILSDSMVMIDILLYVFVALLGGALFALAYLAWEGIARKQNQEQIPHIDALWRGNLFQQKIGKAILAGYGYAGLSLATWAIGMYFFRLVYFQYDGQLGFMDPSSTFPWVTTLLNSWLYTWFTTFGVVALVTSVLMSVVGKSVVQVGLASIVSALFIAQGYNFVDITGIWYEQWIVYILMIGPVILAFKYYGIITAAVSIWVMFVVVRVFVYLGSTDESVHLNGLFLLFSLAIPFVVGLVFHHFGRNSLHDDQFIPEYEQKLKKQMRLEREFQIAKESQYALLPKSAPEIKGVDVKGFFIPSFDVGGDFYEHVLRVNDHGHGEELFVTIVDVSGKGMKAALSTIFTSGLLLSRVRSQDCDPAKIVSDVNDLLYERLERQMFVTCILAKYNMGNGQLEYVNAGHCQPILVRDGKARLLSSALPRFPMGIRAHVTYNDSLMQLESGDTVFFYSDGLPEAKSGNGALFDYANVPELCEQAVAEHRSSSEMCEFIKKRMLNFSNYELADDLTVVVLRV